MARTDDLERELARKNGLLMAIRLVLADHLAGGATNFPRVIAAIDSALVDPVERERADLVVRITDDLIRRGA